MCLCVCLSVCLCACVSECLCVCVSVYVDVCIVYIGVDATRRKFPPFRRKCAKTRDLPIPCCSGRTSLFPGYLYFNMQIHMYMYKKFESYYVGVFVK